MKLKFDSVSIKTGLRTAGSLMVGNAFVAPLILDNKNWVNIGLLLFLGIFLILATSFSKGDL